MNQKTDYTSCKKLVVFGISNVGKTTLKTKIKQNTFDSSYKPSENSKSFFQFNFFLVITSEKLSYVLTEKNQLMTLNYLEVKLSNDLNEDIFHNLLFECQCALFFIDFTSYESYTVVRTILSSQLFKWKEQFPYLTIILVGNKKDATDKSVKETDFNSLTSLSPDLLSIQISLKDSINDLMTLIHSAQNDPMKKIPLNVVTMSLNMDLHSKIPTTYKIILVGDSGVGKTALMNRHFKNEFSEEHLSTFGVDFSLEAISIKPNDEIKAQIWDTAGQERFRAIPKKYYQNADGILLLFSFDILSSFENVSKWINDIVQDNPKSDGDGKKKNDTNLILVGNKFDIENRLVSRAEAEMKAKDTGFDYYEISCKLNINIDEVIANIVLKCHSKFTGKKDFFNLGDNDQISNEKGGCCSSKKKK